MWLVGGRRARNHDKEMKISPTPPETFIKNFPFNIFCCVFAFLCGNKKKNKLIKKILRFGEARMNVLCFG